METIADKVNKAQNEFNTDVALTTSLNQHMQNKNFTAYSQEFSTAAQNKGIQLTVQEVTKHFGFGESQENPTIKQQVKETVKDEVKGAAKDEATGRAEDEIGNQLGVDLGGVSDAAGGFLDTIKGWFGSKKKK